MLKLLSLIFFLLFSSTSLYANTLLIEPDDRRDPILKYMHDAKSIDLILYGLTDPIFIDALIDAKKSGKTVNVMLEPLPYKQPEENIFAIKKLKDANVTLIKPNPAFQLTHQKTLIFDHEKALVMTMNLTKSSFKNQRNFAILIDDPAMIKEMMLVYDQDSSQKKSKPMHSHLIFSPDNSRLKILNLINHATNEIKIYAQTVSDYEIIGALAKAAKRGVKVAILTEGQNPSQKRWDFLRKAGVKVCFEHPYFIHAKVMIVDKKILMLGSINFTKPSLDKNRELSVILEDGSIIRKILKTFGRDWKCDQRVNT